MPDILIASAQLSTIAQHLNVFQAGAAVQLRLDEATLAVYASAPSAADANVPATWIVSKTGGAIQLS
jgi:hypothetical protein